MCASWIALVKEQRHDFSQARENDCPKVSLQVCSTPDEIRSSVIPWLHFDSVGSKPESGPLIINGEEKMLIPLSWLKEYVDLNLPVEELADRLTLAGMEIEEIRREGDWWDPATIVVGQVVAVRPHPNADRLTLVDVNYGPGVEQVVTGAPNLYQYKDTPELPVLK